MRGGAGRQAEIPGPGFAAMEFSGYGLTVLFHVLFGSLWFGAAAYQVIVIGPAMRTAGPAGGPFVSGLIRGGRVGRFFALSGGLAVLFGVVAFLQGDVAEEGMQGRGLWINLGATLAIIALIHGAAVNMPTEKRLRKTVEGIKGPPNAAQQAELQALGMRMGRNGAISLALVGGAILLMLMQRVFV